MGQLHRDQFWHYFNTATKTGETSTPTWVREGTGLESLSVQFNPQKDTYKTILSRQATTTFNNYQMSSSVSGKRCYSEDPIYDYLDELRKTATSAETQCLEINTAKKASGDSSYEAVKYDILITINEWLGENATISYDVDYTNPVQGTVTIADGKPTFVPTVSL